MTHDIIPLLSIQGIRATPTGLAITANVTFETWMAYGAGLRRVESAVPWCVGDWLLAGEARYGEQYSQALEMWPESSYQSLANIKSVASRVDPSRRRESLSWSHHEAIARLDPAEQSRWLEEAERTGMSVRELRDALRGTEEPDEERCPECGAARRYWHARN